ncbi:MAG: single-stranded-DNA-specific exonuclease [Gammaproteobacteria bacterium]|jgi:single-stranded-DNA-specific exonuclease
MSEPTIVRRPLGGTSRLPDDYHPVVKRVLAARGVLELADLDTSLDGLFRADSLGGVDAAVTLLERAIVNSKNIVIVADFDADGATSCAVAIRALTAMGARDPRYLVPNRFEYGYGLTPPIVELAKAGLPDLLITVDNGISSIDGVAAARASGIDVIITDHHLPGAILPNANAIVNPNVPGDAFPSKCLAGVGVIFYVMLALRKRLLETNWFKAQNIDYPNLAELLDLVALGTVADVVPLDQNNRRLVAQGLARIRFGKAHAGIRALLKISGKDIKRLNSIDLAFAVAPRLNAAGRLADMSLGIECLISDNAAVCDRYAIELDDLNRERREIESEMKTQAVEFVDAMRLSDGAALRSGICLIDESWHQGVVGIIASRIKERYHRPVIAFAPVSDTELKGSGRSIPGVHLRDALDAIAAANPGLLSKFGGHAMAAGLTLGLSEFELFSEAFDAEINRQVGQAGLTEEITTDGALSGVDFDLDLATRLGEIAPWGQLFPEPLFDGIFRIVEKRIVGESHLRMKLQATDESGVVEAIAFGAVDEPWARDAEVIHAAYRLSVNEYRGSRTLQLIVTFAQAFEK